MHPLINISLCAMGMIAIARAQTPTASEELSVASVHRTMLNPASDTLFAAERKAPKSERSWDALKLSAQTLVKAATLLHSKELAHDRKNWAMFAGALRTEANSARRAAELKDRDELIAANGRMVAICESCHDEYRDGGHGMTSDRQKSH